MWTGRQALAELDGAVARLHSEESGLDQALQSAMQTLETERRQRNAVLTELARVKLDELASGRLASGLDSAERRALDLIRQHREALGRNSGERDKAAMAVAEAEARQRKAAETVEAALAEVEAQRARTDNALAGDPKVAEARAKLAEVSTVAEEARRKAEQNMAELAAKKAPYDADPLFRYLWDRGFGTSAYGHSGLTRFLDRWVAAFIGYSDIRANYHMLNEIPQRLKEHAEAQGAMVEVYREALTQLEAQGLTRDGMPKLVARLGGARTTLAQADKALEQARQRLATLDAERDGMMTGESEGPLASALALMAAQDSQDDLRTLMAEAKRTATPADEALVRRIETIDRRIAAAESELTELRRSARQLAERRVDVERARDRFRRSGYDHPHARFPNDGAISDALGGVLSGALKGAILWDILRGGYRQQEPQGRPDFGGGFPFPMPGGFGGSTSGDGWHDPGSSGSWSPMPDPPSGPWGGGGDGGGSDTFSTGGRF
jgi:chromosome segregation ATPase